MQAHDVAQYLKDHPQFFEDYADEIAEIYVPHPHGGHAIPIAERQILALRDKNAELAGKLAELVRFGAENDATTERLHRSTLALFAAPDLEATLAVLCHSLREDFAVPHVAVRLWGRVPEQSYLPELAATSAEVREYAERLDAPATGHEAVAESARVVRRRRIARRRSRSCRCALRRRSGCSRWRAPIRSAFTRGSARSTCRGLRSSRASRSRATSPGCSGRCRRGTRRPSCPRRPTRRTSRPSNALSRSPPPRRAGPTCATSACSPRSRAIGISPCCRGRNSRASLRRCTGAACPGAASRGCSRRGARSTASCSKSIRRDAGTRVQASRRPSRRGGCRPRCRRTRRCGSSPSTVTTCSRCATARSWSSRTRRGCVSRSSPARTSTDSTSRPARSGSWARAPRSASCRSAHRHARRLRAWIAARAGVAAPDAPALFVTRAGRRLGPRAIERRLAAWASPPGTGPARAPAHAAPLVRVARAAVLGRPARGAGAARARVDRQHAGLHAPRLPGTRQGVRRRASARPTSQGTLARRSAPQVRPPAVRRVGATGWRAGTRLPPTLSCTKLLKIAVNRGLSDESDNSPGCHVIRGRRIATRRKRNLSALH